MKVCLLGAGYYAQFHLAAWSRLPGVEVVGIADLDAMRARLAVAAWPAAKVFSEAQDMVHECKPDLVDIITPEATHGPLVGLLAGKVRTLMCQKPMAPTLQAARAMVDAARQAGTELLMHENFRFQPWFREARRLLDEGVLGEVRAVTARLRRINPAIAGEDAGIVIYEFRSGAVAILDANRDLEHDAAEPRYTQGSMLLEGTLATWRLDGAARTWLRRRGEADQTQHTAFERIVPNGDSVFHYLKAMLQALDSGQVSNADIAASRASAYLKNLEIEEAIYKSASENRTVTL